MKMMDFLNRYTYRVTWSEGDGEFVGTCAEFPSLSWLASDGADAFTGIRNLVADVLEDMAETGETPPPALSLKSFSGKFMVRVPPEVHRRLAIEAEEARVSLNRLVSAKLSA